MDSGLSGMGMAWWGEVAIQITDQGHHTVICRGGVRPQQEGHNEERFLDVLLFSVSEMNRIL